MKEDVRDLLPPPSPDDQTPAWLVQGQYTWGKALTLAGAIENAELEDGDDCIVMRADTYAHVSENSAVLSNAHSIVYKGEVADQGRTVLVYAKIGEAVQ